VTGGSSVCWINYGCHSKSAINTMFNTGTVVGVSSMFLEPDFPRRHPVLFMGRCRINDKHDVEKALGCAKRVMARRNIKMTNVEEKVFNHIF